MTIWQIFVEGNATPLHYYDMDGRVIYVKSFVHFILSFENWNCSVTKRLVEFCNAEVMDGLRFECDDAKTFTLLLKMECF